MFFNFDKINNSEQIRLGQDFKLKVDANGRKFTFWLNSESVKHRDLPQIYEEEYSIPDDIMDDDLMQLLMPRGVELETEHHKMHFDGVTSAQMIRRKQTEEEKKNYN